MWENLCLTAAVSIFILDTFYTTKNSWKNSIEWKGIRNHTTIKHFSIWFYFIEYLKPMPLLEILHIAEKVLFDEKVCSFGGWIFQTFHALEIESKEYG